MLLLINLLKSFIMSVTIVGFKQCESREGKPFVAIELQGELRLVQSETTGNFYLTANKCRVSTSFPVEVCQTLIGQKLTGTVEKVSCEPYEYTNRETGEIMTLDYTYVYSPKEKLQQTQSAFPPVLQQPFMHQQNQSPLGEFNLSGVIGQA